VADEPTRAGTTVPPPPPPAAAPPGLPWWAAGAGAALVAAILTIVILVTHGDGPASTLAASTTTTGPATTSPSTVPATTIATTTTVAPTTTATTSSTTTTSTTAPGGGYDQTALDYFREIAGAAEFGDEGGVLHRWTADIRIAVYGNPTARDDQALDRVVDQLNELIHGIEITVVDTDPNLEIYFVPVDEFPVIEPNYVEGNMGYVYIWWDAAGSIYSGRVLISTTGLNPQERAHLIREELTQGLGLLNDSWLYPDSIFYQGWTETTSYAPIDRLVIEMLYRPELTAGMGIDQAVTVLAGLTG
jgi:hypothetical protein